MNLGEKLASLPGALSAAQLTRIPDGVRPGERILVIDGERIAVDADGRLSSAEALAMLAKTPSFFVAVNTAASSLSASWELATPINVVVAPPAALYDIVGDRACVSTEGKAYAVSVIGSELG